MKNVSIESNVALLSAIRGKFGDTVSGKGWGWGLALFLCVLYPGLCGGIIFAHGRPQPLSYFDLCFFGISAVASFFLGAFLWQAGDQKYFFDGVKIYQLKRNGRVWKEIGIKKINKITFQTMSQRGLRVSWMQLQSDSTTMGIILYPSLVNEMNNISSQTVLPASRRKSRLEISRD